MSVVSVALTWPLKRILSLSPSGYSPAPLTRKVLQPRRRQSQRRAETEKSGNEEVIVGDLSEIVDAQRVEAAEQPEAVDSHGSRDVGYAASCLAAVQAPPSF